jgi:NAD(P)-dependent dehydrogenase (short-subunit alcohol dehydrogenase family)
MSPPESTTVARLVGDVVDKALEVTVVGSFSSIGSSVRRRFDHWTEPGPGTFDNQRVAITGATSGLGLAAASAFASLGADVIALGRTPEHAEHARTVIEAARDEAGAQGEVHVVLADLASLEAVVDAAAQVRDLAPRLDVLVSNAGALVHERRDTDDGLEFTLQTHVVAPFRLVAELLPTLASPSGRAGRGGRVITVTSGGMYTQSLNLSDLADPPEPFDGVRAYARAKRAQVALTGEWAWRVGRPGGITFAVMHPGWVDTPGLSEGLPGFSKVMAPVLRTTGDGADTMVWLAWADEPLDHNGALWHDRRPRWADKVPWTTVDQAQAQTLWHRVMGWAGVDPAMLLASPRAEAAR